MMNRIALAAVAVVMSTSAAFGSSCVISEYTIDLRGGAQIARLKPIVTPQNITVTGTSAQSAPLTGDTKMVRLWCDTQSAAEEGTNPTASATVSTPISAGGTEYFSVDGGDKIAFILRP